MSIEAAERLKKEYTDKYVTVAEGVAELRRFAGLTGIVKTVNMSGQALVEFNGPADIGWYDINPQYLTVVDKPLEKKKLAETHTEKPAAAKKPAAGKSPLELARAQGAGGAAKPAGKAEGGKKLSPLELARQQGAAGTAPSAAPSKTEGGKKLSPLELARQQGAAGSDKPAQAPAKPAAATGEGGKKLSPLELARQQGAAGSAGKPAASADAGEEPTAEPEAAPAAAEAKPAKPADTTGPDGKPLSPLEMARRQGAFKG